MDLIERLSEIGFIEVSREGEYELSPTVKLLLVKEFSKLHNMENSIIAIFEKTSSFKLSINETKEMINIVKPLADKIII